MMIISFCNEKGGTGKTSTTALVAWELAKRGKKILAVDCDPQGNLTNLMVKTANQQGSPNASKLYHHERIAPAAQP